MNYFSHFNISNFVLGHVMMKTILKIAKFIRKIGINLINEILESENKVLLTDDWLAIKFDWMRRIGDFEELINECEDINLKDRTWSTFLQFQLDKAKNKDSSCYSMHDANRWNKEEGI